MKVDLSQQELEDIQKSLLVAYLENERTIYRCNNDTWIKICKQENKRYDELNKKLEKCKNGKN